MSDPTDREEELLADLRDAGHLDPPPVEAVAAVRAAFVWRTIDVELAQLTSDSARQEQALASVRSTAPSRFLTFDAPQLTVELEVVAPAARRRRLIGQLVPPQLGEIEVRHGDGSLTVAADEMGRFAAEDVSPGPVSLRCRAASGATVETDWVLV